MHFDATLRVRELTQNIYDIGDEIADYIDHVRQAMGDWDRELVADCLEELRDIVAEGRAEARAGLAELNGLRQAFVSGVRAGSMSNEWGSDNWRSTDHPGRTLSFMARPAAVPEEQVDPAARGVRGLAYREEIGAGSDAGQHAGSRARVHAEPTPSSPAADTPRATDGTPAAMASTASWRMWLRAQAEALLDELETLQPWVISQTRVALESQSVLLPQCYMRAEQQCRDIHERWLALIDRQPALVATMRGEAPPSFLTERARVNAVLSRVQRRRRGAAV